MVQQNIAARSISAMREWRQRTGCRCLISFSCACRRHLRGADRLSFADGIGPRSPTGRLQPGSFIGFDNFAKLMVTDEHFRLGAAMNSLVLTVWRGDDEAGSRARPRRRFCPSRCRCAG